MKRTTKRAILFLVAMAALFGVGCDSGSSGGGAIGGGNGPDAITLTPGTATTVRGNPTGGVLARDVCPSDQMLIGLSGEKGAGGWIVRLQAICGVPQIQDIGGGQHVAAFTTGTVMSMRGRLTGTAFTRRCSDDKVLVGSRGRAGLLIDQLTLQCARIVYSDDGSGGWTYDLSDLTDLASAGGTGGTAFAQTNCAAGQVAYGANIRHGDSIDGFGMLCATPTPVDVN